MTHDDGKIHRGSLPSVLHEMHQKEGDNARTHLMHDYGSNGAKFLFQHYNHTALVDGILLQRAQMRVDGALYDANNHLEGKIDLSKLGVSQEHIQQVEALCAEERGISLDEQMRRSGLDVDCEGHGVRPGTLRGVQPRPATQPVGRVNDTGNGAERA